MVVKCRNRLLCLKVDFLNFTRENTKSRNELVRHREEVHRAQHGERRDPAQVRHDGKLERQERRPMRQVKNRLYVLGQSRPLFAYFRFFHIAQFNKLMKAEMVCFGLEPRVAGWKAKTNPLSYDGTLIIIVLIVI